MEVANGGVIPVDIVLIANVSKEPDLALGYEHGHAQSVDRRITKSFVVKPAASVKPVEVFLIGFAPEVVEVANLKV